ncbi:hypothetical protein FHX41_5070 [Actinomadura hallensis]|uniref:Carbohydrate binding protein n=1 Tax=Actinomadura hallensis TaxID=337895 RepID=A0A543IL51_9ACTN|nr:hypothetical protein [Actinomadura hallensis]TQM71306.1 hypothetical protein FHX41_5070 [Actinomadura hallensis]
MTLRRVLTLLSAAALAAATLFAVPAAAAPAAAAVACDAPDWVPGQWYLVGSVVRYSDGDHYIAVHENPPTEGSRSSSACRPAAT